MSGTGPSEATVRSTGEGVRKGRSRHGGPIVPPTPRKRRTQIPASVLPF